MKKERRSDAAAVWTSPDCAVLRGGDRRGRSRVVRPFVARALRRPIRRDRTQVRGREGDGVGAGLGRQGAPASAKRRVPAEALTGPGADVASGARLHGYGPARCELRGV